MTEPLECTACYTGEPDDEHTCEVQCACGQTPCQRWRMLLGSCPGRPTVANLRHSGGFPQVRG